MGNRNYGRPAPYAEGPPPVDGSVVMQHYSARFDYGSELLAKESVRRTRWQMQKRAAARGQTPPVTPPDEATATRSATWWASPGHDLTIETKRRGVDTDDPL